MNRNHFLGNIDLGIVHPLLKSYSVPTKIPNCIKLNKIKQQNDLILIELGSLLTSNECDEILMSIQDENFQNMKKQYDTQKRNNQRLIVIDDRFARTLWRRLKFSHRLTKLISNTKPLGFNVQGTWQMSGVNRAMRFNKYHENQYFTVHKDAQYAPNADERSLLSLIIYLTDDFEKGETKFYFPTQSFKADIKGLTVKEEIQAYGGLDHGYDCITIKPQKGFAVLFSHNLLHEAVAPVTNNSAHMKERIVLRTDVLVQRKEKLSGFAISPEEKDDYYACLNFFRQAQQNELNIDSDSDESITQNDIGELYERSLSIRYCYPRLLELKPIAKSDKEKSLIEQLPNEMWLSIFKHLDKKDIHNLIFAFPDFQLLKIVWESQELKSFQQDASREKFIPTIATQYGSQTLFRFSDTNFFYRHIDQCCRVAAVYAFFLLGNSKRSTTYTVHYDRDTQEICEVEMERILSDVFYNRKCYGSLYRVTQKDKSQRQPMNDLNHSVDRIYMTNRHQSQFIGQDLLSKFHFNMEAYHKNNEDDEWDSIDSTYSSIDVFDSFSFIGQQRDHALRDRNEAIVEPFVSKESDNETWEWPDRAELSVNDKISYRKQLLKQFEQSSGASLCRMLSAKDHLMKNFLCNCPLFSSNFNTIENLVVCYNQLLFDFDTHKLSVEDLNLKNERGWRYNSLMGSCVTQLKRTMPQASPITYRRVNIEKLAEKTKGFNHASCQCSFPDIKINQFSFLDYTYLSHVDLAIARNDDHVLVLAVYGGIAAF